MARLKQGISLFRYPNTMPPVSYVGSKVSATGDPIGMLPHSHPHSFEVCLVVRGNMEWWSGTDTHELKPHDVYVTPPRVPHGAVDSALSPCEYLWVHIDVRQVSDAVRTILDVRNLSGVHRQSDEAGKLVTRLYQEHCLRDSLSPEVCQSMCTMLAASLARTGNRDGASGLSELVQQAQSALMEGDGGKQSIAHVARSLYISDAWLTRRFREEVGLTPAAWVTAQKMNEAKRLLRMTDESVTQIALSLGYSSSQYFATAFHRITGRTPSAYRTLYPRVSGPARLVEWKR